MGSNIRNEQDYIFISSQTEEYLSKGIGYFVSIFQEVTGLSLSLDEMKEKNLIMSNRLYDIARAMNYDLLRYARFHDIKKIKRDGEEVPYAYDISESVYAAYAIKWITMIHPLAFDVFATEPISIPTPKGVDKYELSLFYKNRFLSLCNEYYAVFVASVIMASEDNEVNSNILNAMDQEEADSFLYSLRYRLKHQDAYSQLLKRIYADMNRKTESF